MSGASGVTATRSTNWWSLEVTAGLPANMLHVSQARRLNEVEEWRAV